MTQAKLVTVVIPIYKTCFSSFEKTAWNQCIKILNEHPITIIKPQSLDISKLYSIYPFLKVENFDDHYFKDIQGYNKLMLSSMFYERFLSYKFILIYQLDAFVFKDDLLLWCNKDYDYVGAPFGPAKVTLVGKLKILYQKFKANQKKIINASSAFHMVGNGGFSLRKTHVFYNYALQNNQEIKKFIDNPTQSIYRCAFNNEDVFWSILVNKEKKHISMPRFYEALHFSIESDPLVAIRYNKCVLPFGCHAWYVDLDRFSYWKQFIKVEYLSS